MDIQLTKDADYLICKLYANYMTKRNAKVDKFNAKQFGNANSVFEKVFSEWNFNDFLETFWELARMGFVEYQRGDNTFSESCITDKAIIYMENRFKGQLNEALYYIEKLKV